MAESDHTVTVSLPAGSGSLPIYPGTKETTPPVTAQTGGVDIIVYFSDKVGIHLNVDNGQNKEAGALFDLVLNEFAHLEELDAVDITKAQEAFSLWLVSDLLELQLKSTHIPFRLVCYWEELLQKYTSAPAEEIQRDEPVIMFKRNVYYTRDSEKQKIKHESLLRLLYHEAKGNIISGHYPLSLDDCHAQAGLQAVITQLEKRKDSEEEDGFGTPTYFKANLSQYLPLHHCKRNWIIKTGNNPEKRISQKFHTLTTEEGREYGVNLPALYTKYLEFCWKLPYYGAAYFRGQAEHPKDRSLLSRKVDDPVYVAINTDGVSIIDQDDVVHLLHVNYKQLSWQKVESSKASENTNCLPCLFLQFPSNKPGCTNLLQIFSKEAVLMDNLIEACIQLRNMMEITSEVDTPDGARSQEEQKISAQFERLALITLNERGQVDHESTTARSVKKPANRVTA